MNIMLSFLKDGTMQEFAHFHDYYAPKIAGHPLEDDFTKVLEWAADKPGAVFGHHELAAVISDGCEVDEQTVGRTFPLAVMLTCWSQPLASTFFIVKDANGDFHDVAEVDQDVLAGSAPYVIPATGETLRDFRENAYLRFRFADFVPAVPKCRMPSL